jgi:hypothetical protein
MWNKYARVGETMTWIVATIAIIVVLMISIFISAFYLGEDKEVDALETSDVLATKSLFSYLLTKDSEGKTVYVQLKEEEDLNDFNGNLALQIFRGFYGEEYLKVWLGFILNRPLLPYLNNDYFGERPSEIRGGDITKRSVPHILEDIYINENKTFEMALKIEG